MSNFVKGIFGQTSDSSTSDATFTKPIQLSGRGSLGALGQPSFNFDSENPGSNFVSLPGGIDAQRRGLFGQTQGLLGDVETDIQSLRGNQNPFVRARVRPTEEKFAALRADTERNLARRGISGTLATNELLRIDEAGAREVADQGAKAEQEALFGVLQRQDFQRSLLHNLRGFTQDDVAQALNELQFITGSAVTSFNTVQQSGVSASGERQGDPSRGIGTVLESGVDLFKAFS